MPNWTKEQKKAIDEDGKNIIVSAGAGSGKTAVLTERVIRKLKSGVGIDQLLILTFTKAAANEMKTRIRDAIKIQPKLHEQLKKIDSSYITTFDSFSLSLVQKYHYLLNIKKNISIIDSNLLQIKIKEYLDSIMEEEYQRQDEDFIKLINDFCIKDDQDIRKAILNINAKLDMKYNKKEYLNNYIENYYNKENINSHLNQYIDLLLNIIKRINISLTLLSHEVDIDYLNTLNSLLNPLIYSNNYDMIKHNANISLPKLPKGSSDEAKVVKEKIKKNLDNLKELTKYQDVSELVNSIVLTKEYAKSMIRIIQELDKKINNYKFENDLYDFVDISKLAIKLVKENINIKNEVQKLFDEIMVDEYQDTSDLQEEFINIISNNNVYAVGDIKQSIYRFRNANPNIFRQKYHLYSEEKGGIKIDLLDNFRSRREVINSINLIFQFIMSELIGGANYKESHQMIFGNNDYEKSGKTTQNNDLEVYTYSYDKDLSYTKEEIEAFIIAKDIKERITSHFQVYDKKKKELRDAIYSDFTILVDRSTSFDLFKKIFQYHQIPLSIYQDEKLTDSELFLVIRNIFKLITLIYEGKINQNMQYAYLSIGRSFLFNYTDQELFDTFINSNYQETVIVSKINEIVNNISSKTISIVLDEIIERFDIYNCLRRIPNIESNYVKLEYLYTLANSLNQMGYSFLDFDKHLDDILNSDEDIKFSMNKEDNVGVRIMTIHASKGLEYPICYFPLLSKKMNDDEIKGKILYNDNLGIIMPYNDDGMDYTFYHELLKNDFYQEEISEKIRLFYVALTRSREKIIIVLPNSEEQNESFDEIVQDDVRLSYRSFKDILLSIKEKLVPFMKNIDISNLYLTKDYNLINSDNMFEEFSKTKEKIEIIDFLKMPVYLKEEKHFSKNSFNVFNEEEKSKMNFGSMIHYYLETIDFHHPDLEGIEKEYQDKIKSFLQCDLLKKIDKAKVYQEYEFIEEGESEEKHGIIDLMLEYTDHIDIIDYKLKNIDDVAYVNQLNGYKNYIEKLTNKSVNTYLYSIVDSVYKKIGND